MQKKIYFDNKEGGRNKKESKDALIK